MTVADEKNEKTKLKKLTPKQWGQIEAMWESGDYRYEDLIAKYGCSQSTLERYFKKHKIVKGSKAKDIKKKVEEKLAAVASDEAAVQALRIRETKDEHYKIINGMGKLLWNEILQAKQDKTPVAVRMNNIKALNMAIDGFSKVRQEKWALLGLDKPDAVDPDELPELVISKLTDAEIEEMRNRDDSLDDLPADEDGADNGVVEEGDNGIVDLTDDEDD